jgi:hypothetical protein
VVPDPVGGFALALSRGRVRVLPLGSFATVCEDVAVPELPWIGSITLQTGDRNAALRRWLQDRTIPFRAGGGALLVQAGGVVVRFVPA